METLRAHREAWERRPLLRAIYREWFERVACELCAVPGPTVELGAGIGAFKEFHGDAVATDLAPTPWADEVVDAEDLRYPDASVANLVMIDVFHHIPAVALFLDEAVRVLRPAGRIVLLEPYCSPISTAAYRRFHHERTDLSVDPWGEEPLSSPAPWDSNQALATLMFWRQRDRFQARHPELRIRRRARFGIIAWPLSGGFTKRPLVPGWLARPVLGLDRSLGFAAPLVAFRCLVVLERTPD